MIFLPFNKENEMELNQTMEESQKRILQYVEKELGVSGEIDKDISDQPVIVKINLSVDQAKGWIDRIEKELKGCTAKYDIWGKKIHISWFN